ncbi:hypothetical protein GCM10011391_13750 [Pullulanibacillus camelliae]|uniref:Uncharacterized protein n=1 Tax=Pullulanibacillus camelliae TaxID=1707096 RepID=A0A8J2VPS3_9BACL|nr:DUF6470 family protein [Pullulanibacillus camelliae]GGE36203.1 hypothetical protein GCM10011391_13750 [Pullulanibacillus camelliae]
MQIPSLTIHSTMGQIHVQSTPPEVEIQQHPADQTIEQPKAEMSTSRTPSKLTIDQKEAWNNLNLKSAFVRISEAAENGRQAVLEGIARRAEEGDDLLHIERGGNPIKDHAVQNAKPDYTYDTGHTPPFLAVKESYTPSQLSVNWQTKDPVVDVQSHAPTFQPVHGHVDISMAQYPSVTMSVAGKQINEVI